MGVTTGASIGCVLMGEHNKAFKNQLDTHGYAKCNILGIRNANFKI